MKGIFKKKGAPSPAPTTQPAPVIKTATASSTSKPTSPSLNQRNSKVSIDKVVLRAQFSKWTDEQKSSYAANIIKRFIRTKVAQKHALAEQSWKVR